MTAAYATVHPNVGATSVLPTSAGDDITYELLVTIPSTDPVVFHLPDPPGAPDGRQPPVTVSQGVIAANSPTVVYSAAPPGLYRIRGPFDAMLRTATGVYVPGVRQHTGGDLYATSSSGGAYVIERLSGTTGWGEWVDGAERQLTPGEHRAVWRSDWYFYDLVQYVTGYVLVWTDIAPGGLGDLPRAYGGRLVERARLLYPLRSGVADGNVRWRVRGTGAV